MKWSIYSSSLFVAVNCLCFYLMPAPSFAQDTEPHVIVLKSAFNQAISSPSTKQQNSKIEDDLRSLQAEYLIYLKQINNQQGPLPEFRSSNLFMPVTDELVVVDLIASNDSDGLVSDLRQLGAVNVEKYGRMVSARVPIFAMTALDKLSSLKFARPAYAITHVGSVTSQGDAASGADVARQSFQVNGSEVIVGTLSDSYDCLNGAAAGVVSGDLPSGVVVLEEAPCSETDEGRAMMEIVHDIAPGSAQIFHTAFLGQASFAQGIIDLANAGAKVINDDVSYFAEPFFQDGIIAQAVDTVNDRGVAYFSAAGNQSRNSYQSPFRSSGMLFDIGFGPSEAHDFDPGTGVDICQSITIRVGAQIILSFQWDEPYFSVSGAPGSSNDLDIVLTNQACDTVLARGVLGNVGNDPIEVLDFQNSGPSTSFNLVIVRFSGKSPGLMKGVVSESIVFNEYDTASSTSVGHANSNKGLGVGAANYRSTPRFGVNPPRIEKFSSVGGTAILFDLAGNRLSTALIRLQPGITAPDGTDTTFFGFDSDGSGFPNFFGTSAAAPHAAGVAALIKSFDPSMTPDQIYSAMQNTATDMDDPSSAEFDLGFDFISGFGLIQANTALESSPPVSEFLDISRGAWRAILQ